MCSAITRRLRGIHTEWHFRYEVILGGERGLRTVYLGGIPTLTRRYILRRTMKYDPSCFIDEIYNLEAGGMLADLAVNPNLILHFMGFEESDRNNALAYIKSILAECYDCGHLKVAISHENEELYGYALMFVHPEEKYPKYLHKIFVKEQYRRSGIGTKILSSIIDGSDVCLLCPAEKISFYEKFGFSFVQKLETQSGENFQLSKGLYADLCVMKTHEGTLGAPIFLLNDKDIESIIGL